MVGMEDEDAIHCTLDGGVDFIFLGRHAEGHAQEIARVAQRVVGLHHRLTNRILIRHGGDGRHFRDQPVAGDLALLGIRNVGAVVIEGRQRADHAAHDRHGVRIAAETLVELAQLVMQHGVPRDRVGEIVELGLLRQFAVEQQVGDFHERRIFRQLADRIAAVQQDAFFAVDIGQRAFAAGSRLVARVVGELAGGAVQLADVDHVGANAALQHGEFLGLTTQIEGCLLVGHACLLTRSLRCLRARRPAHRYARATLPCPTGPTHRKCRVTSSSPSVLRAWAARACRDPVRAARHRPS